MKHCSGSVPFLMILFFVHDQPSILSALHDLSQTLALDLDDKRYRNCIHDISWFSSSIPAGRMDGCCGIFRYVVLGQKFLPDTETALHCCCCSQIQHLLRPILPPELQIHFLHLLHRPSVHRSLRGSGTDLGGSGILNDYSDGRPSGSCNAVTHICPFCTYTAATQTDIQSITANVSHWISCTLRPFKR